AAQPSSAGGAGTKAPIATVGSRLDSAHSVPASRHGPPSGLPYRALDQAIYARAKAQAQQQAAHGIAPYARGDFSITASPGSQTVVRGSSTTYTVSTQATSGAPRQVSLSVSGLPAGATGTFNPASVTAGGSSVLTIATTTTAATGTFTLSVAGQYPSGATHSTTVGLTVTAPVIDDFAISASPSAQSVVQGSSTTYTVGTQVASGAARSVSLSISGLPAGASGAFAPAAVTAGQSATLTVTTTAAAAAGTSTLAITGQYPSGPTHSTSVSLVITAASATGPTIGATWNGQSEADLAPPDPTGAIGPNSYIQLINLR